MRCKTDLLASGCTWILLFNHKLKSDRFFFKLSQNTTGIRYGNLTYKNYVGNEKLWLSRRSSKNDCRRVHMFME